MYIGVARETPDPSLFDYDTFMQENLGHEEKLDNLISRKIIKFMANVFILFKGIYFIYISFSIHFLFPFWIRLNSCVRRNSVNWFNIQILHVYQKKPIFLNLQIKYNKKIIFNLFIVSRLNFIVRNLLFFFPDRWSSFT